MSVITWSINRFDHGFYRSLIQSWEKYSYKLVLDIKHVHYIKVPLHSVINFKKLLKGVGCRNNLYFEQYLNMWTWQRQPIRCIQLFSVLDFSENWSDLLMVSNFSNANNNANGIKLIISNNARQQGYFLLFSHLVLIKRPWSLTKPIKLIKKLSYTLYRR